MDDICTDTIRIKPDLGTNQKQKKTTRALETGKMGLSLNNLSLIWNAINYIHLFLSSLYDWVEIIS